MSLGANIRYQFMKNLGAPALFKLNDAMKKKRPHKPNDLFAPPLKCTARLKEIMTRHYFLARYAPGAKPVAWVTSGAPVELLRVFGFYTFYPENHGAMCGASRMAPELCQIAEEHGYNRDVCSYARCDLGHYFSGKTPAGKLPKPALLFASNNICQTVLYWYKALAHYYDIPLIHFDTPFNFQEITDSDLRYMARQLEGMIPELERISGRKFDEKKFLDSLALGRDTSQLWGEVLATMKARPSPLTIFDTFFHMAPVVSLRGLPVALEYYKELLAELRQRVADGVGAIRDEQRRLMWDNIAMWYKVRDFSNTFARRGCNFVAATYTNAWAETIGFLDPEDPFTSIAKTYSLVILNDNLNSRLNLMAKMIREYQVDGLVIHSARSCKPYSVGQYDLKRLLMERLGVPSVIIEADITDSRAYSEEQTRTRLEAFFESLGV